MLKTTVARLTPILVLSLAVLPVGAEPDAGAPVSPPPAASAGQTFLAHVLSGAAGELSACGTEAGLAADPGIELSLALVKGKVKATFKGLEKVAAKERKLLEKCLRATIARHAVTSATVPPVRLTLQHNPAQGPPIALGDVRSCQTAADCTLMCAHETNCCSGQCGCSNAVNKAHVKAVEAASRQHCSVKRPQCPAVACALQHYRVTCEQNRCKAVRGNGPIDF